MWQLNNHTPFAADRAFVRDRNGAEIWLVAVKATFIIHSNGSTEIAAEQPPVTLAPHYRGDPVASSLLFDSDLVRTKTATDVLVHGHAYAPEGQLVRSIDVGLQVGTVLTKRLRVFGNRYWEQGILSPAISQAEAFDKIPIIYENAFGGMDQYESTPEQPVHETRNPVGKGFAIHSKHIIGQALPNIEDPDNLINSWKHHPAPAGFGPIAQHWVPRTKWAGTYDDHWLKTRQPLLPDNFDDRYYHCAPSDQQIAGYLQGGEEVTLVNLTPTGLLQFHLPEMALGFKTFFNGSPETHDAKLHSVILEPDAPQVSLVWHTHLNCHGRDAFLEKTIVFQKDEEQG